MVAAEAPENVHLGKVGLILSWADRHRGRTGAWPHLTAGPVADAPWETWGALNQALRNGHRGLPGGSSLGRLLAERRGRRRRSPAPPLHVPGSAWAGRHQLAGGTGDPL